VPEWSIEGLLLAGIAAAGGVLAWFWRETLKQALNPKRSWRRVRAWARGAVPARGSHFAVLVADLEGDEDGRQTRHVRNALQDEQGFEVHLIGRRLAIEDLGNQTEALLAAERRGRAWLDEFNGDVLVWGEVDPGGKGLHLRFLGREGGLRGSQRPAAPAATNSAPPACRSTSTATSVPSSSPWPPRPSPRRPSARAITWPTSWSRRPAG
jgi:hypothetical protein